MSAPEVFRRITGALDQAGVAYMLTGSFASSVYGAPRATQDIDLVIKTSAQKIRTLVQSLPPAEYYVDVDAALEAHRRESVFNVIDVVSGWKIDFIVCKSRPFSQEEFGRRKIIPVQGLSVFTASAEDVLIAKLEWARLGQSRRQIEDAAGILRARGDLLDHGYLENWIRELRIDEEWRITKGLASERI